MRGVSALLLITALRAQTSHVPYEKYGGPLFSLTPVKVSRPSGARSIRDVDFRNFDMPLRDETARLKDGKYENELNGVFESVELRAVYYLDKSCALAVFDLVTGGGSSTSSMSAQLFRLSSGKLTEVQEVSWDIDAARSETPSRAYSFDESTKSLTVRASHYTPGDAHCCISAVDVAAFVWKGDHFEQASVTTELSAYGTAHGKVLPR
jgi:hypothetical protein